MALRFSSEDQLGEEKRYMLSRAFQDSPVFSGAYGATLIAGGFVLSGGVTGAGGSLAGTLILCLFMAVCLPVVGLVSCAEAERMNERTRPAFYIIITAATVLLLSLLVDNVLRGSVSGLGIYIPLVAVDSLVLHRTETDAPIMLPGEAVIEAAGCAFSFAAVAIPAAFVRELLGSGSLLGFSLGFSGASAFKLPFFGFILCGLLTALYRAAFRGKAAEK